MMATSKLPDGWKNEKLSTVCVINPKKSEIKGIDDNLSISFVPMDAVDEVYGRIKKAELRKIKDVKKGYTYFREGDILFAKITPCMENGKATIAKDLKNGIGFGSTEFHVLRPNSNVLTEYIFNFIRQPFFREEASRRMTGTAGQLRVPTNFFEEYEIPIPPLKIQKLIITEIEKHLTRLEANVKSLKVMKSKLDLYRKSVLKAAFSFKTKLDVEEENIGDCCEEIKQIDPRKALFKDFVYVDIGGIDRDKQTIINPEKIQSRNAPLRARQETFPGDIVYSSVRVYMKKMAIVPEMKDKIISSTGFIVLRTNYKLLNKYLFFYLQSDGVIRDISNLQVGTSYPAIRKKDLWNYKVIFPKSIDVQREIIEKIEYSLSFASDTERAVDHSLSNLEFLKKSILKSAFEGKLVNAV